MKKGSTLSVALCTAFLHRIITPFPVEPLHLTTYKGKVEKFRRLRDARLAVGIAMIGIHQQRVWTLPIIGRDQLAAAAHLAGVAELTLEDCERPLQRSSGQQATSL
jgi:hypothetical protein